jgi:NAD-dependent SIR2 family protein deacetylase
MDTMNTFRTWLDESSHVLVAAGAGLSAAAGYDYGDMRRFAELFPALHRRGLRARYQLIGLPLPSPLLWGYWSVHVNDIRFGAEPNPLYRRLRALIGDRDHFVLTSNVDGLFARNGFAEDRVWTPQGDYARYQCELPCTEETWASRPIITRALAAYDPHSGMVVDDTAIPACPNCGGPVFLNVRKGPEFVEAPYQAAYARFTQWRRHLADDARLLVIEIGAGLSTPGVVRRPAERIAYHTPGARLVRINPQHPEVPGALGDRALPVTVDITQVLDRLVGANQARKANR